LVHEVEEARKSPVAAVKAAYAALEQHDDPALFISLKPESEALSEARRLEQAGSNGKPLYGQVFAVKDNIDVAGLPTTAACAAFEYRPTVSAFAVEKLERAGAIAIGKTNLDQFATGLVGVRSPYGVPRNALRADLIPGGSSSGSAVAVAAGIVDFALGTDTAGSGRIPAGMNGIVGLKPTLGLLSATGMVPACRTLDTISVFAASVATALATTRVAAGYDVADAYSRSLPLPREGAMPPAFRVGVPRPEQRLFFGDIAAEAAYAADLTRLTSLGAEIVELNFEPLHAVARLLYEGPWVAERYAATRPLIETDPGAFHPVTRKIISGAEGLTAVSAFEAQYKLAGYRRTVAMMIDSVDCLAVPTIPRVYTLAEVDADPLSLNSNLGSYTNFVNLLDLAAISVPSGLRSDGLPSSLTLIGRAGCDGYLAALAAGIAGETLGSAILDDGYDRIEIAVVGAHLSGLPLNGQLRERGAVLLRQTETLPEYALYALSGTMPPKPGLLRVGPGEGSAIAVEVWSLDAAGFGTFVADIPPPLGIGTLSLADGTSVKGFVVEAEAVRNAVDISACGGWRSYLAGQNVNSA
jgi:allophanate hydrolase